MAGHRLDEETLRQSVIAVCQAGSISAAARALGVPYGTLERRVNEARSVWPGCLPPSSTRNKGNWAKGHKPKFRVRTVSQAPALPADPYAEWRLEHKQMLPAFISGDAKEFFTEEDHTFKFGALGDTHACSKYFRRDVLEALFDIYEAEGVKHVFHTGNWIDGEARFNVHDLHVRGMDAQCRYLADIWPKRPGITTYAITGDDHEGWYAQREGVDIGRYVERCFHDLGRTDWVDLGYMEAPVKITNKKTGAASVMSVVHPGGGSSYAVSYSVQKIIESLDGGEKPHIALYGHYHKLWAGNVRNVWVAQTGTQMDQSPFMRKKKLEAHVGGMVIKIHQDPDTGAVTRFLPEIIRYFNKGYYTNRWSHHGRVEQSERTV